MKSLSFESISFSALAIAIIILFIRSFVSEKGKNAATKQDIEEITEKIETIKTEFIKETEKLKHELQFANQMKVSFNTDLKNAVVGAYEAYSLWVEYTYDAHLNSLEASVQQLQEAEIEMNKLYTKFITAGSKLELYYVDKPLGDVMEKLLVDTINFQTAVEKFLVEIESTIVDIEEMEELPDEDYDSKESDKLHKSLMNDYNKAHDKLAKQYGKIAAVQEIFRDKCHAILTQHIN